MASIPAAPRRLALKVTLTALSNNLILLTLVTRRTPFSPLTPAIPIRPRTPATPVSPGIPVTLATPDTPDKAVTRDVPDPRGGCRSSTTARPPS